MNKRKILYLALPFLITAAVLLVGARVLATPDGIVQISLGPGDYYVNWAFEDKEAVYISGVGDETHIYPTDLAVSALAVTNCNDVRIENVYFHGRHSDGATDTVIRLVDVDNVLVDAIQIHDAHTRGLDIEDSIGHVTIRNSRFISSDRDAIYVGGANSIIVAQNYFSIAPDVAIDLGSSENAIVESNTIYSAHSGIVIADDFGYALIRGNLIHEVSANGVNIHAAEGWSVVDNLITGDSPAGLSGVATRADSGTIMGNDITGFGSQAIRVEADKVLVSGNAVHEPYDNYGIYVTGTHAAVVCNLLDLADKSGIYVSGDGGLYASNLIRNAVGPAFYLENADYSFIVGNSFVETDEGVWLTGSTHNIVEANVAISQTYNDTLWEFWGSDYNLVRRNMIKNSYGLGITGTNSITKDNDWW